jgi:signal transduction histidine kinase
VLLVEDLTDERALAAQVAHQERLASIGRLAAGVAHEVGNPLTGIKLTAANLRRELTDPTFATRLDLVLGAGDRIDRIVRALVGYAHAGDAARGARGPVSLWRRWSPTRSR